MESGPRQKAIPSGRRGWFSQMDIKISKKQKLFIDAGATEVLFGG